jgi:hypothetical protein
VKVVERKISIPIRIENNKSPLIPHDLGQVNELISTTMTSQHFGADEGWDDWSEWGENNGAINNNNVNSQVQPPQLVQVNFVTSDQTRFLQFQFIILANSAAPTIHATTDVHCSTLFTVCLSAATSATCSSNCSTCNDPAATGAC